MMNHHKCTILLCIISLTLFNCNEPTSNRSEAKIDYTGFHEVSFELYNELGRVQMMIPDELDSSEFKYGASCNAQVDRYWFQHYKSSGGKLTGTEWICEFPLSTGFQIINFKQSPVYYSQHVRSYTFEHRDSILNDLRYKMMLPELANEVGFYMIDGANYDFVVENYDTLSVYPFKHINANFVHKGQNMNIEFFCGDSLNFDTTWVHKTLRSLQIAFPTKPPSPPSSPPQLPSSHPTHLLPSLRQ